MSFGERREEELTIYDAYVGCCESFSSCGEQAQLSGLTVVEDELGRFRAWASNIGSLRQPSSSSSLDARLRNSARTRQMVLSLLRLLRLNLVYGKPLDYNCVLDQHPVDFWQADRIFDEPEDVLHGLEIPRHLDFDFINMRLERSLGSAGERKDESEHESSRAYTAPEISMILSIEALKTVHDIISQLQRLSTAIRRASAREYDMNAARERDTKDGVDAGAGDELCFKKIVDYRYPQANEQLREFLSTAMSFRARRFTRLRHQHERQVKARKGKMVAVDSLPLHLKTSQPLSGQVERRQVAVSNERTGWFHDYFSASLPFAVESDVPKFSSKFVEPSESSGFFVRSSESMLSALSDTLVYWPGLPKPQVDEATGDLVTKCPYCFDTLEKEETQTWEKWREHLKKDLEPYNCFFPECQSYLKMFSTESQWLSHLKQEHTRKKWFCRMRSHPVALAFDEEEQFKVHMKDEHRGAFPESQLETLSRASYHVLDGSIFDGCPLGCPSEGVFTASDAGKQLSDPLIRHIANHLLSLAMESLPSRDDSRNSDVASARAAELVSSNAKSDGQLSTSGRFETSIAGLRYDIEDSEKRVTSTGPIFTYRPRVSDLALTNLREKAQQGVQATSEYYIPFSLEGLPLIREFVDRTLEMSKLEEYLLPSRREQRRRVVIMTGLSGIGKTQLAIEFTRRNTLQFSAVIWLDGRSEDTLKQSITAIAARIPKGQIPETSRVSSPETTYNQDPVVKDVLDWLGIPENHSWLVVFDDIDPDFSQDLQAIMRYFPRADHGSILITTRLFKHEQLGTTLRVDKFNREQALAIFTSGYRKNFKDSKESNELLSLLDGHPLAITQASAFMRETTTSFDDYIEFFRGQQKAMMRDSVLQLHILEITWTISYQSIRQNNEPAANLLLLLAWLDNKDFWFELLTPAYQRLTLDDCIPEWFRSVASNRHAFIQCIKLLLGYGLVEKIEGLSSYSVRPVLHKWTQHMQEERQEENRWLAKIIIGMAVPDKTEKELGLIQRRLLPHADCCVKYDLGGHSPGRQKCYSNVLTLDACRKIGNLYADQGKLNKAEKIYQRALQEYGETLGEEHISTLTTIDNLGNLYAKQGRLEEAEEMYQRTLQGYKKALGKEHPSTLATVHDLGYLYTNQGKFDEAEKMYRRALWGYEKTLGKEHPLTLTTINNLGNLYAKQGRLDEKKEMHQRASQRFEKMLDTPAGLQKIFGKDHERYKEIKAMLNDFDAVMREASPKRNTT